MGRLIIFAMHKNTNPKNEEKHSIPTVIQELLVYPTTNILFVRLFILLKNSQIRTIYPGYPAKHLIILRSFKI